MTLPPVDVGLGADRTGWGWEALGATGDLDGIPLGHLPAATAPPGVHPNGAVAIDHVVVMTPDLPRTIDALAAAGLELRRVRDTTLAGSPHRQAFYRVGPILEVVGPADPTGDGAAELWGLALVADDLDAAARHLGDRLGPVRDAVQPGRRIATLRTGGTGVSVAMSLMSPHRRSTGSP